jgi:hypothetical protein
MIGGEEKSEGWRRPSSYKYQIYNLKYSYTRTRGHEERINCIIIDYK